MDLELLYSKEDINGVQYKINCLFKLLYPYAQIRPSTRRLLDHDEIFKLKENTYLDNPI